jgi:hypothetical protein
MLVNILGWLPIYRIQFAFNRRMYVKCARFECIICCLWLLVYKTSTKLTWNDRWPINTWRLFSQQNFQYLSAPECTRMIRIKPVVLWLLYVNITTTWTMLLHYCLSQHARNSLLLRPGVWCYMLWLVWILHVRGLVWAPHVKTGMCVTY